MKTWLAWILAAVAMALAFAAYLRPDFMLELGNRIVMCF